MFINYLIKIRNMKIIIFLLLIKNIILSSETPTSSNSTNITDVLMKANFTNKCSTILPSTTEDCISASDDDSLCCLLEAVDTPLPYRICNSLPRNHTTPLKRVSNMLYKINCTGVEDYQKYFPFEGIYTACGIQNPKNESDCFPYPENNLTCCLASTTSGFDNNPMCYLFGTQNGAFQKDGFYFRCSADALKLSILFLSFIFSILL
jgi:hypothetical protein